MIVRVLLLVGLLTIHCSGHPFAKAHKRSSDPNAWHASKAKKQDLGIWREAKSSDPNAWLQKAARKTRELLKKYTRSVMQKKQDGQCPLNPEEPMLNAVRPCITEYHTALEGINLDEITTDQATREIYCMESVNVRECIDVTLAYCSPEEVAEHPDYADTMGASIAGLERICGDQ